MAPLRGLLVDFGGVLTTNVFASFRDFCEREGIDPETVISLFRGDAAALAELRRMERGEIGEDEFAERFARRLGIAEHAGLVDRLFAGIEPDGAMVAAVKRAKASGVRTGLISNSFGAGRYDRASFPELFDAVVISGEVGLNKPEPEIFLLGCERVALAPQECAFVDDLRENCEGAEAVGMTAVLHRGVERTLPRLEQLLGVHLDAG